MSDKQLAGIGRDRRGDSGKEIDPSMSISSMIETALDNPRQEAFCIYHVLQRLPKTEAAVKAGYSRSSAVHGTLMTFPAVVERIKELKEIIATQSIMSVAARKAKLSEIGSANLRDFQQDGVMKPFDVKVEYPGALAEVSYDEGMLNKIKLHDPVKAIAELNKMERIYETGTTINIDNRKLEIIVSSDRAKELTDRVMRGERSEVEKSD